MIELRIVSISPALASSPTLTSLALCLLTRAQVMGFLPHGIEEETNVELNVPLLDRVGEELRAAGIALQPTMRMHREGVDLAQALRETLDAVDASPRPQGEWGPARELLGDDLLARITGISVSSLRRYASDVRPTPDDVAWRLHLVARICAALLGSYNDYGVRRWFERSHPALEGAVPAELIATADTDDPRIARLLAYAEQLLGAGAAA